MKLLEKIKDKEQFTYSENIIVDYLLKHKNELLSLSISELAKKTYTSNATIIRLCRKLGFDGYKTMKAVLLNELEAEKYIVKDIDYSVPFHNNESTYDIFNSLFSLYRESINFIQSNLDEKEIEKIVECIIQSKRMFIYAVGDAKITAQAFINKMIKINYFPILATENQEELHIAKQMKSEDCALFMTYSAKQPYLQECINIARNNNVPCIMITANSRTPVLKKCKYHIIVPDYEREDKIATFYSQLAFLYILSLIYSLIYNQR